jgi:hypothetical protein
MSNPSTLSTAPPYARKLLWVDCIGAALVGVAVLALSEWLSELHGLPRGLLLFTGAVNLLYGSYSFSLARRDRRPLVLLRVLVFANATWACVCVGLLVAFGAGATPFGVVHLGGEALYVGGLAVLEWRWRHVLLTAA